MNPLELLIKSQDLDELMRRMKYLIDTRRSDKVLLAEMNSRSVVLDVEERVLGRSKLNLEKVRIDVESKKTQLFNEKENLAVQQSEQSNLLALSKQRESSYEATLSEIEAAQNQVTQQITAIIRAMYERGEIPLDRHVEKGERIGFQGYTGITFGSHLHLEVYNSAGQRINPFAAGYFSGGSLGSIAGTAKYHYPLQSGVVTQTFHGGHLAIDLQSSSHGDQSGSKYYGEHIVCYVFGRRYERPAGYYNARGTGAEIRAITDGYVSGVRVDNCGGKYVILKHDDGGMSLYLHLQ